MLSFLFSRRDEKIYPHDEYGDELYRAFPTPADIPHEAIVWFDTYFEKEADADAMTAFFVNRGCEVNRDFDEEDNDGYGPWNVDAELGIKPSYRELRSTVEQMKDRIRSFGGQTASFVLSGKET